MQLEHQGRTRQATTADFDSITLRLDPSWRCRVLIVDDDDIVRAQLMGLLRRSGYSVRGAASAPQAMQMLDTHGCDILFTDWEMPTMNGLELCRQVRLDRRNVSVYVMMLTVRHREQDMLVGLAAGADDFIVKGAPVHEILERLAVARRITHLEHSLPRSERQPPRRRLPEPLTN